jgi:hypothetical protein
MAADTILVSPGSTEFRNLARWLFVAYFANPHPFCLMTPVIELDTTFKAYDISGKGVGNTQGHYDYQLFHGTSLPDAYVVMSYHLNGQN